MTGLNFGLLITSLTFGAALLGIFIGAYRRKKVASTAELDFEWDELTDEELDALEEAGVIEWISAEEYEELTASTEPPRRSLGSVLTRERPKASDGWDGGRSEAPVASDDASMDDVLPEPSFAIGETVVTVNPFTRQFVYEDYDGTPLYYDIMDVQLDEKDRTYRYLLSGEGTWVAEDWIKRTNVAMMVRENAPTKTVVAPKKDKPTAGDIAESHLRQHSIDTYLDMMNAEDEAVKAEGKRLLQLITAQGGKD